MPGWSKSQAETGNELFYDTAKHGWFWYEDHPPEEKTSVEDKDASKSPRPKPSLAAYTIHDLWNLYPDDFQALLTDLQKKAVQYPTEENILEYLRIQDIARRKALAYTHAASYVTQKHPELFGMNQIYPTAGPGVTARIQLQQEEITAAIDRGRDNHALLFFTRPDCSFCRTQQQILVYFEEKYSWQIKPVDISQDSETAARFNITVTPTLLLIKKGNSAYLPVATGVITLSELERKLFQSLRALQGETTGEDFMVYDFQKGTSLDPASILINESSR